MGESRSPGEVLLDLYDRALPVVYGYLVDRCGDRATAEDLTSETFLAAVTAAQQVNSQEVSIPWLVGVARHKLVDHWRRQERQERLIDLIATSADQTEDPWPGRIDALRSAEILADLKGQHRAALTLRYVDGLPVAEVAELLGRSLHATETILVRAKAAYRAIYTREVADG